MEPLETSHKRTPSNTYSYTHSNAHSNTHSYPKASLRDDGTTTSFLSKMSKKTITFRDVKSEFETEAEATILKALEESERKSRMLETDDNGIRRPSFLAGIPSDKIHLFEDSEEDSSQEPPKANNNNNNNASNTSTGNAASATRAAKGSLKTTFKSAANRAMILKKLQSTNTSNAASGTSTAIGNPINSRRFKSAANRAIMLKKLQSTQPLNQLEIHDENEINDTSDLIGKANAFFRVSAQVQNDHEMDIIPDVEEGGAGQRRQSQSSNDQNQNQPSSSEYFKVQTASPSSNAEVEKKNEKDSNLVSTAHSSLSNHSRKGGAACCRRNCGYCFNFIKFAALQKKSAYRSIKLLSIVLCILLGTATILFYLLGNPLTNQGVSYSWFVLLIARLFVTFTLAILTETLIIDYLFLETQLAVKSIGRVFTLMTVQAKGWPMRIVFWALWNWILIIGDAKWKRHWLCWQSKVGLFSTDNPGSEISFLIFLMACMIAGLATMFKRAYFAYYLGRKKYEMFSPKIERVMREILYITEVAFLAEEIENEVWYSNEKYSKDKKARRKWIFSNVKSVANLDVGDDDDDGDDDKYDEVYNLDKNRFLDESNNNESVVKKKKSRLYGIRASAKKRSIKRATNVRKDTGESDSIELEKVLGEWEEPDINIKNVWDDISIGKILEFREAVDYLGGDKPFSVSFGLADTRKHCMESAVKVYKHLLLKNPEQTVLHFDTLSVLASGDDGILDLEKARSLIRLFRPDCDGNITMLNFLKACDKVYRRLRLFRATVVNSNQLDDALEIILNIFFYALLTCLILSFFFAINPTQIFLLTASITAPVSFAIGSTSSKWFEGVLFVLVRKPFDIGDRIAISDPKNDTNSNGSTTWFVEKITLYFTTVRNAATNEVATYNNGYLAGSRIINAARSPKAQVYVNLKFGIDISYEKVKIFRTVVETFVNERPQEWLKLAAFRANAVEADLGYISYVLVLQHVESWQNVGAVLESKAEVSSFCLEVAKQMEMRFVSPPKPINLSFAEGQHESPEGTVEEPNLVGVQKLFEKDV